MKFDWDESKNQSNLNIMSNISKTDWNRIDEMKDEDIDTSDIPPLSEDFWAKAQLRMPNAPVTVEFEVYPETFACDKTQLNEKPLRNSDPIHGNKDLKVGLLKHSSNHVKSFPKLVFSFV